jgi:hypothetical protein
MPLYVDLLLKNILIKFWLGPIPKFCIFAVYLYKFSIYAGGLLKIFIFIFNISIHFIRLKLIYIFLYSLLLLHFYLLRSIMNKTMNELRNIYQLHFYMLQLLTQFYFWFVELKWFLNYFSSQQIFYTWFFTIWSYLYTWTLHPNDIATALYSQNARPRIVPDLHMLKKI